MGRSSDKAKIERILERVGLVAQSLRIDEARGRAGVDRKVQHDGQPLDRDEARPYWLGGAWASMENAARDLEALLAELRPDLPVAVCGACGHQHLGPGRPCGALFDLPGQVCKCVEGCCRGRVSSSTSGGDA